jgi:hypothetical protein
MLNIGNLYPKNLRIIDDVPRTYNTNNIIKQIDPIIIDNIKFDTTNKSHEHQCSICHIEKFEKIIVVTNHHCPYADANIIVMRHEKEKFNTMKRGYVHYLCSICTRNNYDTSTIIYSNKCPICVIANECERCGKYSISRICECETEKILCENIEHIIFKSKYKTLRRILFENNRYYDVNKLNVLVNILINQNSYKRENKEIHKIFMKKAGVEKLIKVRVYDRNDEKQLISIINDKKTVSILSRHK